MRKKSRRKTHKQQQYSVLEGRRLLAVSASLSEGTLSIFGDAADNSVTLFASGDSLNIVGDLQTQYSLSDVSYIRFFGADGDDFFDNNTDIDTLASGNGGDDEIRTGGGADRIFGGDGNDTLIGNGGDDRIVGHDGVDQLFGGDGNDALFGLADNDVLHGDAGDDTLVSGFGDDVIHGGDGDDLAFGHFGDDEIFGGEGNDRLFGQNDNDIIHGEAGNDTVRGGLGDDLLEGNAGDDRILGDEGVDDISGADGRDIVFGGAGDDLISGGEGNDLLFSNDGDDVVYGDAGNDVIRGNGGNDRLFGGDNADRVDGDDGDDYIEGGLASDVLLGDVGNDTIVGEVSDRVTGGAGDDAIQLVDGGNDILFYSGAFSNYLITNSGDDLVIRDTTGADGLDVVTGADSLVFSDGARAAQADVTRRVFVQPIVVSDSNGSNEATFFGDADVQFEITRYIDEIYLQAGIDIEFLETRTTNNTFFNFGSGSGVRFGGDLNTIVSQGDSSGVGNSDPLVLDVYFVNRVPAFQALPANFANGLAFVGGSGIAMHVGEDLLTFTNGKETVARVAAHEIGHNLGLGHVEDPNNLLAEGDVGEELNAGQVSIVRNSQFSQTI